MDVQIPTGETFGKSPVKTIYGGFWSRLLASFIDIGLYFLVVIFTILLVFAMEGSGINYNSFITFSSSLLRLILSLLSLGVINWLYFTLLESSEKQATVGKMAVGLMVTDLNGNRISFGRANGRYLGKFVSSAIWGIGFIMAGFTKRKQALHDIMAGTLVIREDLRKAERNAGSGSVTYQAIFKAQREEKAALAGAVKKAQLIGGSCLLTLGVLFILDRLVILDIYVSWPLLLVTIGVGLFISNPHSVGSWVVGGIGTIFFVTKFVIAFFPEMGRWSDLIWPLILIICGGFLLYRYYNPRRL